MGTLIIAHDSIDKQVLQSCREMSHEAGVSGLTQPDANVLIVRYMGDSTGELNDYFTRLWQVIRAQVLRRDACHPRIWNT